MKNITKKLFLEDHGQGLVEYSLIITFITIVIITALELLGVQIFSFFNSLVNNGL